MSFFIAFVGMFINYFYVIQVSNHSESECPLTVISYPYLRMGCERKVRLSTTIVEAKRNAFRVLFPETNEITKKNIIIHQSIEEYIKPLSCHSCIHLMQQNSNSVTKM